MSRKKEVLILSTITIVILFLVGGFFYTAFYEGRYLKYKIKKDKGILQGARVTKVSLLPKSANLFAVSFTFDFEGRQYNDQVKNGFRFKKMPLILERTFPVVYDKNDITNTFILIRPEDFEYFDISFPDSLNWVTQDLLE